MFNDAKNQKSKFLPQPGFELQGSQHWSKIGDFLTFIPFFRDEKAGFEIFKPDFRILRAILPPWARKPKKNFSQLAKNCFYLSKWIFPYLSLRFFHPFDVYCFNHKSCFLSKIFRNHYESLKFATNCVLINLLKTSNTINRYSNMSCVRVK